MSDASLSRIISLLAAEGYTAEKAAARRLQRADDPHVAVDAVLETLPEETITLTVADVDRALEPDRSGTERPDGRAAVTVIRDMTGSSTGTGTYDDFVALFRDRYDRLRPILSERVSARSAASIGDTGRRHGIGVIGMITDIRSTANGHWIIDLEDRSGTCRALVHTDSDHHEAVRSLFPDQVIGVEGTLSDDGGLLFVDELYEPDVPVSHEARRADRNVEVALVSDLHVGSEAFAEEAWEAFAAWLHTPEAAAIEYLVIGGDLVDGVGVYPGQSDELSIVDIDEQYEAVAEHLTAVPSDLQIVIIPGNHDAVRLAEPQPGFDEPIRSTVEVHDATVLSNPAWIDLEGVTLLLYHGTSLDDVIAEVPGDVAGYDRPERAMELLLRKRHLAPQFGSRTRIAPEERDYLVIDPVPDVLHSGHTHTFGVGSYRDVRLVNGGCWQYQTPFQRKVDIEPDVGVASIIDLRSLDVTVRTFA